MVGWWVAILYVVTVAAFTFFLVAARSAKDEVQRCSDHGTLVICLLGLAFGDVKAVQVLSEL